ncbi:MAG TPA: TlpA disulfide reductase family protein [Burkholderiaceae bacterium]|jgi:peroxiredoxin|nr:TlpA disulfide reductase family protein [Burkholderiaceae bacterium]
MQTPAKLIQFALNVCMCLAMFDVHAASSKQNVPAATKTAASLPSDITSPDVVETERTIRELMELDQFKEISYRDEHGAALTSNEFYQCVTAGQPFATAKLPVGNNPTYAVLSLLHKDAVAETRGATYKIKRGDKFPSFRLPQMNGQVVESKQLSGRYTLINFFFAQCGPCVKEVPDLNAVAARHHDMNFVAMTFDSSDETKQFVADRNFEWKILPDAKKFIAQIGVHAYPSFALLDPHGVVLGITGGSEMIASDNSLENWMTRLVTMSTSK